VLSGTTASLRGITGDAGKLIQTEYAGDQLEWEHSLADGIPTINTGISEMWYLDRVSKICSNQPGGRDPKVPPSSYFWQTWQTYRDHDPYANLARATMDNRSLMLGGEVDMWGEGIDDTNFEPHVFPAVSAAAEQMWTMDPAAAGGVADRLQAHRCALVSAGIRASPIGPGAPCSVILQ